MTSLGIPSAKTRSIAPAIESGAPTASAKASPFVPKMIPAPRSKQAQAEITIDVVLDVTLDGDRVANAFLDDDGKLTVDISQLGVGDHALKVFAKDQLEQETRWFTEFSITYPEEGITEIIPQMMQDGMGLMAVVMQTWILMFG